MSVADRLAALTSEQRALFEALREKQRRAARLQQPAQPPPIGRVSGPTGEGDWPLSLDQERFWFVEQLYPGRAGLSIVAATRMRGRLSIPWMAAALAAIARRHAAWRTTFPAVGGAPVQRVAAEARTAARADRSRQPCRRRGARPRWRCWWRWTRLPPSISSAVRWSAPACSASARKSMSACSPSTTW